MNVTVEFPSHWSDLGSKAVASTGRATLSIDASCPAVKISVHEPTLCSSLSYLCGSGAVQIWLHAGCGCKTNHILTCSDYNVVVNLWAGKTLCITMILHKMKSNFYARRAGMLFTGPCPTSGPFPSAPAVLHWRQCWDTGLRYFSENFSSTP